MDIKERIELVISRKGLTKSIVAERMGKIKQNFNSLITDARWSVIEEVAAALEISVSELIYDQQTTSVEHGVMVCPKCHTPLRLHLESIEIKDGKNEKV